MELVNGWLTIQFDGSDWSRVTIAFADDGIEHDAYFGFDNGRRVVQIRPNKPSGSYRVLVTVDGIQREAGRIQL